MISDEAVEAAAKAVYGGDHLDGSPQREAWLRDFRIALEAAAPIVMGKAVEDAALLIKDEESKRTLSDCAEWFRSGLTITRASTTTREDPVKPALREFPVQIAHISDEDLADADSLRGIIKAKIDAYHGGGLFGDKV